MSPSSAPVMRAALRGRGRVRRFGGRLLRRRTVRQRGAAPRRHSWRGAPATPPASRLRVGERRRVVDRHKDSVAPGRTTSRHPGTSLADHRAGAAGRSLRSKLAASSRRDGSTAMWARAQTRRNVDRRGRAGWPREPSWPQAASLRRRSAEAGLAGSGVPARRSSLTRAALPREEAGAPRSKCGRLYRPGAGWIKAAVTVALAGSGNGCSASDVDARAWDQGDALRRRCRAIACRHDRPGFCTRTNWPGRSSRRRSEGGR